MSPPGILQFIVALVAGAGTVLSFGPFNQYWIGVAGPAVLFYLWRDAPPRRAFFLGIAFGAGLFGRLSSIDHVKASARSPAADADEQ